LVARLFWIVVVYSLDYCPCVGLPLLVLPGYLCLCVYDYCGYVVADLLLHLYRYVGYYIGLLFADCRWFADLRIVCWLCRSCSYVVLLIYVTLLLLRCCTLRLCVALLRCRCCTLPLLPRCCCWLYVAVVVVACYVALVIYVVLPVRCVAVVVTVGVTCLFPLLLCSGGDCGCRYTLGVLVALFALPLLVPLLFWPAMQIAL